MSDIVERLRKWSVFGYGYEASCDMKEAADEIDRLEADLAEASKERSHQQGRADRNAREYANAQKACEELRTYIDQLRAALEKIASNPQQRSNCFCGACIQARAARAALGEKA